MARAFLVEPADLREANRFVLSHHRNHGPVRGHRFSLWAIRRSDGERVGVVILGRPPSRRRQVQDPLLIEITRLCTDGTRNACSFLYGAAARAARALGYQRIGSYTLPAEGGASLRAAGWVLVGEAGGGAWRRSDRPVELFARDTGPTERKWLWEVSQRRAA